MPTPAGRARMGPVRPRNLLPACLALALALACGPADGGTDPSRAPKRAPAATPRTAPGAEPAGASAAPRSTQRSTTPDAPQALPPAGAGSEPGSATGAAGPFRGPGPSFAARRQRALGVRPEHLLAGDLDGDGDGDLLVTTRDPAASSTPGRAALLFFAGGESSLGPGLLAEPRTIEAGGWPLRPVLVEGPLRHRPRPDAPDQLAEGRVALASRALRTLTVLDPGSGVETLLWSAGEEGGAPMALAAGDWGADGEPDLALVTDAGRLVLVGGGAERSFELTGGSAALPRCVLLLADGGGAVVGYQDSMMIERIGADGSRTRRALGFLPRALLEIDADGDGALELVVLGGRDTGLVLDDWSNAPPSTFRTPAVPIAALAADVDGDGVDELLVLGAYGLRYEVFATDSPVPRPLGGSYAGQEPTGFACADLDGDGRLDLAIANEASRALSLVFGDGRGLTGEPTVPVDATPKSLALSGPAARGGQAGELGVLCAKARTLRVFACADDSLTPLRSAPTGEDPRALTAIDLDRDGAPELAWLASGEDGFAVETEAGRTAFAPSRGGVDAAALELGGAPCLAVANDVDGALVLVGPGGTRGSLWADRADTAPTALAALEAGLDGAPGLAVALGAPGSRRGLALVRLDAAGGGPGGAGQVEALEVGFLATAGWPVDVAGFRPRPESAPGEDALGLVALTLAQPGLPQGSLELFVRADGAWTATHVAPVGGRPQRVLAADLDGSGFDELMVVSQNDHAVHLFDQLGASLRGLDALGAHLGCLDALAVDLDDDGRLELVVANGFSDDLSVIRR